jgi:transposase
MTTHSQANAAKQENNEIFVGIDVSQDELVVHVLPTNQQLTEPNSAKGIAKLVKRFQKIQPTLILFEATGGLERNLLIKLFAAGMPCVVLNPRQARRLAEGLGEYAKTDRIDAMMLAVFASLKRFAPRAIPEQRTIEMSNLVTRRRQLIDSRTMEKNRLHAAKQQNRAACILRTHKKMIAFIDKQIDDIDTRIQAMIDENTDWDEIDRIIQSIPGCGPGTAQTLISAMPEMLTGNLNRQQVASLVGVAPFENKSGKRDGKAHIYGGRADVRSPLFMAATNVIKPDGIFKSLYDRLRAKGKLHRVAMVAVMRKLITTINAMIKTKTLWNEHGVRSE